MKIIPLTLMVVILNMLLCGIASADLARWKTGQDASFIAHYKIHSGKIKLIKMWVGSDLDDLIAKDHHMENRRDSDDREFIIVNFWQDEGRRLSGGWVYEVLDGKVMLWEDKQERKIIPMALGDFYIKIEKLLVAPKRSTP